MHMLTVMIVGLAMGATVMIGRCIGAKDYKKAAARPFNSRLDKSKLVENGFTPLPTWQDALGRYLKEIEF